MLLRGRKRLISRKSHAPKMTKHPGIHFLGRCEKEKSLRYVYLSLVVLIILVQRRVELSRKRKLRELYAYTALVNAPKGPRLLEVSLDAEPDLSEARFLDENNIAK